MNTMKFKCLNCGKIVSDSRFMGTENRNHCPFCLWSKHVDIKPGDRAQLCHGLMKPVGLTFKKSKPNKLLRFKLAQYPAKAGKFDSLSPNPPLSDTASRNKYKKEEKGEVMIVHQCLKCEAKTKNRIAGDDSPEAILSIVEEKDKKEVEKQLFGEKE